jgi:hypothetical protein
MAKKKDTLDKHIDLEVDPDAPKPAGRPGSRPGIKGEKADKGARGAKEP